MATAGRRGSASVGAVGDSVAVVSVSNLQANCTMLAITSMVNKMNSLCFMFLSSYKNLNEGASSTYDSNLFFADSNSSSESAPSL